MTKDRALVLNTVMATRSLKGCFFFAILIWILPSFAHGKDQAETIAPTEKLIKQFEHTVFNLNLWGSVGLDRPAVPFGKVVKWRTNPLIAVGGDIQKLRKDFPKKWEYFNHLLLELTRLTDVWIRFGNRKTTNSINFKIYYYGLPELRDHINETRRGISNEWGLKIPPITTGDLTSYKCSRFVNWAENHFIEQSFAFILHDVGEKDLLDCMLKSIVGGFGLFADSDAIQTSIFQKSAKPFDYIPLNDKIMLRTLYDPRIKIGMAKGEAMKAAAEIIPELVAAIKARGVEALYQTH